MVSYPEVVYPSEDRDSQGADVLGNGLAKGVVDDREYYPNEVPSIRSSPCPC